MSGKKGALGRKEDRGSSRLWQDTQDALSQNNRALNLWTQTHNSNTGTPGEEMRSSVLRRRVRGQLLVCVCVCGVSGVAPTPSSPPPNVVCVWIHVLGCMCMNASLFTCLQCRRECICSECLCTRVQFTIMGICKCNLSVRLHVHVTLEWLLQLQRMCFFLWTALRAPLPEAIASRQARTGAT